MVLKGLCGNELRSHPDGHLCALIFPGLQHVAGGIALCSNQISYHKANKMVQILIDPGIVLPLGHILYSLTGILPGH